MYVDDTLCFATSAKHGEQMASLKYNNFTLETTVPFLLMKYNSLTLTILVNGVEKTFPIPYATLAPEQLDIARVSDLSPNVTESGDKLSLERTL